MTYRRVAVTLPGAKLDALVADSFLKHVIGLMFRDKLGARAAMLFVFPREARHGIWMRNMRFPLDIIWISGSKRVVDFADCVPAESRRTYCPAKAAKYVLEVNAGFIKRNRIKKGLAFRFALQQ